MIYGPIKKGNHTRIDDGFHCTVNLFLGDYIHISPYVTITGGDKSSFTAAGLNNIMAGARIICASDRFDESGLFGSMIPDELKGRVINKPVVMEYMSNIGTNAIVMPGSILRQGVLLCAGSLLMGDTVEWGVYKGNPAKLVKVIDKTKAIENAKKLGYDI